MPFTSRYFRNNIQTGGAIDASKELFACLERINRYNPPIRTSSTRWTVHGLYEGPTSIAYLFYQLHSIYPDTKFKDQTFLDWARQYLDVSTHVQKSDLGPKHCGIANETLASCVLNAVISKDTGLVEKLCSYRSTINSTSKPGSNEWLYGRAGYLYFLRLARSLFDSNPSHPIFKLLEQTISETTQRILDEPLPWIWHGSQYLGAAHGVIGIICQVVLSVPTTAPGLQDLLCHTLAQQYPSGNFPSSLPTGSDNLVQFCHGGPGFILSLESILPYFPKQKTQIENVINSARRDTWNRGLLTKAPSLCHGIAGNALALETSEQMHHFLAHMTTTSLDEHNWLAEAGHTDSFAGLYTGEAGRAWAWAVLAQNLPRTCIGYNDI